jgi:hypothetical protein
LGVQKLVFVAFGGLIFKVIDPLYLGGRNFFNSIPFLTIFNAPHALIGGVQVFFGHHKQWSPPL